MFGVSFFGCYFKMQDVLEGKEELADNSRWTKKKRLRQRTSREATEKENQSCRKLVDLNQDEL